MQQSFYKFYYVIKIFNFFERKTMTVISIRNSVFIPLKNIKNTSEFYTFKGFQNNLEHFAICIGDWKCNKNPLVRIHSECMTGDVFHSMVCDCGEQLNEALSILDKESGILIYLRQEGRGIGLYNKIDSYYLQKNFDIDTYQANESLGFSREDRDYSFAAEMLRTLNISEIKLLTNNPDKVTQLEKNQVKISKIINTSTFVNQYNRKYLLAKKNKASHMLDI
jgi:GTP cyclohydrolase II